MKGSKIKVSFCVAYDWGFLQHSLPLIYKDSDEICLAIDIDRISWTGNKFAFDEIGFKNLIESIDTDKKIKVYQDDFHLSNLSPMGNEVRQRKLMSEFLGSKEGWHLQLDSDEYFLNFEGFVHYIKTLNPRRAINVCCPLITLFKNSDEGFLYIKNKGLEKQDIIAIATNKPEYNTGRRNGHFNIIAPFPIVHQSWARSEKEILQKINNWGHRSDFDVEQYFEFWKDLDVNNFGTIQNFHPIKPTEWQSLAFLPASNIKELIQLLKNKDVLCISKWELNMANSIHISRFRKLIRLIVSK
jgi:hypothetical protein